MVGKPRDTLGVEEISLMIRICFWTTLRMTQVDRYEMHELYHAIPYNQQLLSVYCGQLDNLFSENMLSFLLYTLSEWYSG